MASYPNVATKESPRSFLAQPFVFQRGEGALRAKRPPKKTILRLKHVAYLLLLLTGFFLSFSKIYLFLISWDKLMIRNVEIVCPRPELRRELDHAFQGSRLGNILLCDIERLRAHVRSFVWVKEARIQKIFPSGLRIEIMERTPKALLRRFDLSLIDAEGVELAHRMAADRFSFPVLADRNGFRKHYREKLNLAWNCLDALSLSDRERVAGLDLTEIGTVELVFKDDPVKLRLGDKDFMEKVRFYQERKPEWESRFGTLESVDLRFDDRVYIKSQEPVKTKDLNGSQKEAE